jgi:hypothetical protein
MEFVKVSKFKNPLDRTLSIDLLGGIGNQLFRYYAATTIAERLDLKVRFFLSGLPESHSQFNSRILDLGVSIIPETRKRPTKYSLFVSRVLSYLSAKSVFLKKVEIVFRGIHTESGVGVIEECNLILRKFNRFPFPSNIQLDGHFQDIMYYSNRDLAATKVNLTATTNPLPPILDFKKLNQDLENLCVVHIRRGDFKCHKGDIGLLSKQYYEGAMTNFIHSCESPHFLIISDDMSEAETMITEEHREICTFVQESQELNPAALLQLMGMYKNFILSNSTFSLWIALLAPETKHVAYPMPFNRNLALQVRGFPKDWKPETAYFES